MDHPRSNVIVTGGAHSTSLTAEVDAGELACIKYLTACYKRSYEDCARLKVRKTFSITSHYHHHGAKRHLKSTTGLISISISKFLKLCH